MSTPPPPHPVIEYDLRGLKIQLNRTHKKIPETSLETKVHMLPLRRILSPERFSRGIIMTPQIFDDESEQARAVAVFNVARRYCDLKEKLPQAFMQIG